MQKRPEFSHHPQHQSVDNVLRPLVWNLLWNSKSSIAEKPQWAAEERWYWVHASSSAFDHRKRTAQVVRPKTPEAHIPLTSWTCFLLGTLRKENPPFDVSHLLRILSNASRRKISMNFPVMMDKIERIMKNYIFRILKFKLVKFYQFN